MPKASCRLTILNEQAAKSITLGAISRRFQRTIALLDCLNCLAARSQKPPYILITADIRHADAGERFWAPGSVLNFNKFANPVALATLRAPAAGFLVEGRLKILVRTACCARRKALLLVLPFVHGPRRRCPFA
jgi:hypothetical protein